MLFLRSADRLREAHCRGKSPSSPLVKGMQLDHPSRQLQRYGTFLYNKHFSLPTLQVFHFTSPYSFLSVAEAEKCWITRAGGRQVEEFIQESCVGGV